MIIGWDISTAVVGVTEMTNEGRWVRSYHIDLRKIDDKMEKADLFQKESRDIISKFCELDLPNYHFIEDRLAGFTRGFSNAGTLMTLAAFNFLCSWIIRRHEMSQDFIDGEGSFVLQHIHPSSVKSIIGLKIQKGADKKVETLKFVQGLQPAFPSHLTRTGKPQPYMYDMADSYCVALAGFAKYLKGA